MNNAPFMILVNPQLAENIGMSARAMMNCGLYNMRLVAPLENHLSDKAIAASSGAEEILHQAQVFATTTEAIADLNQVYATTARHRDQIKAVYNADNAGVEMDNLLLQGLKCGILFGPERTGLHNDDVSKANAIINIPLNPRHCSLNLSQAVLLVGYEFYKTQISPSEIKFVTNQSELADKGKIIKFLDHLEEQLLECGNFKLGEKREKMVINLHNIFTRDNLTEQELNTLYGVVNYLGHKKIPKD